MSTAKDLLPSGFSSVDTIAEETPVAYFELVDQRPSGFIQEGTERLPQPNEITAPSQQSVLRTSYYFKRDKKGIPQRVNIRYLSGVSEIEVEKQKEAGHLPNPTLDMIVFKKGKLIVAREGNTIGLFEYLKKSSFNESNTDRDPQVRPRWREVVPEKEKMQVNDLEFEIAEALSRLNRDVVLSRSGGKVRYDEDRLDSYCKIFGQSGSSPVSKINILIALIKQDPSGFVTSLDLYSQRLENEIIQGERLNVIRYGTNTVEYTLKDKILLSVPGAFKSKEDLRMALSRHFSIAEGATAYQEYLIELDAAKKTALNN